MKVDLLRATAVELQQLLSSKQVASVDLVRQYRDQILRHNDWLKTVISITPPSKLDEDARRLDEERNDGHLRSPLHGIPVIIKVTKCIAHVIIIRC